MLVGGLHGLSSLAPPLLIITIFTGDGATTATVYGLGGATSNGLIAGAATGLWATRANGPSEDAVAGLKLSAAVVDANAELSTIVA
ncbi:hypothetical protein GUJ93_ZPchr0012g20394 [Zizania palustris]|uniref:Uncharacterized protein n=1 Tax=Zizania palustris TaxID=103762 RepID=A0A8J6BSM3_ZIZPA|nr:hypothetical protein GUJ93_ZPchr0012g20394 [Zizania palustris]